MVVSSSVHNSVGEVHVARRSRATLENVVLLVRNRKDRLQHCAQTGKRVKEKQLLSDSCTVHNQCTGHCLLMATVVLRQRARSALHWRLSRTRRFRNSKLQSSVNCSRVRVGYFSLSFYSYLVIQASYIKCNTI